MFYFAYGSNLSHKQMQARCPGAVFVGSAKLDGYAFRFDGFSPRWGGAAANVIPADGSSVQGALYELSPAHFDTLDELEGRGIRYDRVTLKMVTKEGETVQAAVYLRTSPAPVGLPTADYVNTIKAGMADCGIQATEALA